MTQAHTDESYALPLRGQQPPTDPVRRGELALRERRRKNGGLVKIYEPEAPNSRVMIVKHRARCECHLDAYRAQGRLTLAQFEAGMKFRQAWLYHAEGIKTRDSTCERGDGSSPALSGGERMGQAEHIIREAYRALSPLQALVVVSVCGCEHSAGSDKRMATLRRALGKLSDIWG